MTELLSASLFGFNLLPTLLLGVIALYWVTLILGVVDLDSLDIDLDTDIDADGAFHGILVFFNLGEVPLMLFISLVFLSMWMIATSTKILIDYSVSMSGILIIPEFIVSSLIVRSALLPFKKLFKSLKVSTTEVPVLENKCILLTDCKTGRIGQAEIITGGASVLINVQVLKDISMKKGDTALVIQKDKNVELYEIIPYKDMKSILMQEGKNVP
jgi:hypothetical protein